MRYADDVEAFEKWVRAFYGSHVGTVTKLFGVDNDLARSYCDRQRNILLASEDTEATLMDWQERVPGEIIKALATPVPELETT